MTRRRGLSLVEVLVALFIMGLGTIAILTLFPLGAMQMAQALKDDRTAQAASQADSYMRWYWLNYVVSDNTTNYPGRAANLPPGVLEPFIRAMEDPNDDSSYDTVNPTRFSPYYTTLGPSPWFPVPFAYSPAPLQQKRWAPTPPSPGPPYPVQGSGLFPLRALYPISQNNWVESGPSYPVIVDPIGWVNFTGRSELHWVANGRIARRTLSALPPLSTDTAATAPPTPNPPPAGTLPTTGWTGMTDAALLGGQAQKTCSLLDGLSYGQNGVPDLSTGAVQREMRYNWLWILQKLHQNDDHTATMTIVVFDKRPFRFVPLNAEVLYSPALQDANGNSLVPDVTNPNQTPQPYAKIGSTLVRFPRGASPPVQKGGWIADVTHTTWTYLEPQPQPPPPQPPVPPLPRTISAVRNCNFYRVVSITDNVADGTVDMELQVPLKEDSRTVFDPYGQRIDNADQAAVPGRSPNQPNVNMPQYRTFMFLAGVSEVFERINLTRNLGP